MKKESAMVKWARSCPGATVVSGPFTYGIMSEQPGAIMLAHLLIDQGAAIKGEYTLILAPTKLGDPDVDPTVQMDAG